MSILTVSHLSKKFARQLRRALWYGVCDSARELLLRPARADLRSGEFWALDDVSFDLARGEALAVVGGNGAGKTTLLRVLYGVLKPNRGEVRLRGRAEALIALGSSFSPVLSGRENIHLAAALHGLSPRQSGELVEKIIDFTELGPLIDAPVQTYSSGMRARLGYALPAHLRPDVLLVDEALAVGDAAFQHKCVSHMRGYLDGGGALLLVSHNTYQIQFLCQRGILLDAGRVTFSGTAVDAVNRMLEQRQSTSGVVAAPQSSPSGTVIIEQVLAEPVASDAIRTGEPMRITVRYRAKERLEILWGFFIWTADRWVTVCTASDMTPRTLLPGEGELTCLIPRLPLVGGRFALGATLSHPETKHPLATYGWEGAALPLDVRSHAAHELNAQRALNQLVTIDVEWR